MTRSVVQVLCEPHWFKGSLDDLAAVRKAVEPMGADRPALLRKDFLLDEYQLWEARLYGADTVLLIVAILNDEQLTTLMAQSRAMGMEPLVEVANAGEMKRALALNARIIGINNRNLHDFTVDMGNTTTLTSGLGKPPAPPRVLSVSERCPSARSNRAFANRSCAACLCIADMGGATIFLALSGITGPESVSPYKSAGVHGVLVGEALMRSEDPMALVDAMRTAPAM